MMYLVFSIESAAPQKLTKSCEYLPALFPHEQYCCPHEFSLPPVTLANFFPAISLAAQDSSFQI